MTTNSEEEEESRTNNNDGTPVYYFAYGALCNPVTRQQRGISVVHSQPGRLNGYRLDFSTSGTGNIIAHDDNNDSTTTTSSQVHGVLLQLSSTQMWRQVQDAEAGYQHQLVSVLPYGDGDTKDDENNCIEAHVFIMNSASTNDDDDGNKIATTVSLPQERYLKIIAEGMRHHGVDETYIQTTILQADHIPARRPEDYRSFAKATTKDNMDASLPVISLDDYQARVANGVPCFIIGDWVIDIVGDLPESPFQKVLQEKVIGKSDVTPLVKQILYDPNLPPPHLHSQWAMDQMVDLFQANGIYENARISMRLQSASPSSHTSPPTKDSMSS